MSYALAPNVGINAHGGVTYDALDTGTAITASFAGGGAAFVTEGVDVSPWLLSAGLGLVGKPRPGGSLGLYYDVQASPTGFLSQAGSVGLELSF